MGSQGGGGGAGWDGARVAPVTLQAIGEVRTEAAAVAELALVAGDLQSLERGGCYSVVLPLGGSQRVLDLEPLGEAPRRKRGSPEMHTEASLSAYVKAHRVDGSALYADPATRTITAVLNGHGAEPGFGDHRCVLRLRHSLAWDRWYAGHGKIGAQDTFADLVELGVDEIKTPAGGELLELIETFHATNNVSFTSSSRGHSGQRHFEYREDITATGGAAMTMEVPKEFLLALQVFEEGPRYDIVARLRFRLEANRLKIGFVLDRPEDLVQSAFAAVLAAVEAATETVAYRGVPAPGQAQFSG